MVYSILVRVAILFTFKIDQTKVLMENGSLMKVDCIAERSFAFCNIFDLH